MQVDLSATGDKLPNAVVAFLTCEVPSPPLPLLAHKCIIWIVWSTLHYITTRVLSQRTDALKFLGED